MQQQQPSKTLEKLAAHLGRSAPSTAASPAAQLCGAAAPWTVAKPGDPPTDVLAQFDLTGQVRRCLQTHRNMPNSHVTVMRRQVALITGGTGWLGAAFAECLAEAGASVVVSSTTLSRAEAAAAALPTKSGGGQTHYGIEMTQMNEVSAPMDRLQSLRSLTACAG